MGITFSHAVSKFKSLADGISNDVMQGKLQVGDNLLSINEASAKYKVSRDTVFKAYNELKRRGVIDSTPQKGYFITGEVNHVLLLLDNYTPFKQQLYHRLADNLPENYKVDVIFHQYNKGLFETLIRESIGKYSMYVVMNFSDEHFSESLTAIPPQKLLLLDFGNFEKDNYAFICQNFNEAFYQCLKESSDLLKKYRKMVFVFPEELSHPASSIEYFAQFCHDEQLECSVIRRQADWKGVEAQTAYLCILPEDLVKIIKDADARKLTIGTNVGLIAYNDDPVLEVIKDGITSISVDFGLMGEMAAQYVKTKELVQEYLPTRLIRRSSL